MIRSTAAAVLAALLMSVAPVSAAERPGSEPVAPSEAVAKAWAKEAGGSSGAVRTLYATYGVVQGLDMVSTVAARKRGAVEANPVMQGSYAKGAAVKVAMGAVTMLAVRAIEKKSKKAAVITMIGANVATAIVVANNMRNVQRLK
jgi:uncharacterized protein DUF5658